MYFQSKHGGAEAPLFIPGNYHGTALSDDLPEPLAPASAPPEPTKAAPAGLLPFLSGRIGSEELLLLGVALLCLGGGDTTLPLLLLGLLLIDE